MDLPDKALAHVATYLHYMTRVMFAVALTAPSSSWEECDRKKYKSSPCNAREVVMSSPYYKYNSKYEEQWSKLDFNWFDESVANKLTDGDICGVLLCTDALNNLQRLCLTNCIKVTGRGLTPLRGSFRLEDIDLSLGNPKNVTPSLSEDAILPILHSMIEKNRCIQFQLSGGIVICFPAPKCLRYLDLPKKWRERQSHQLGKFLETYSRFLNSQHIECSQCDGTCIGSIEKPWVSYQQQAQDYGVQNMICHECKQFYCADCESVDLEFCPCCEGKYCYDCTTVETCYNCRNIGCGYCEGHVSCDNCSNIECEKCIKACGGCFRDFCSDCRNPEWRCKGESCEVMSCSDCVGVVKQCKICTQVYCNRCNELEYCSRIGGDVCMDCHSRTHDIMECHWQAIPPQVQQIYHNFAEREIGMDNLVKFWEECTQLQSFGTDKEFDLKTYEKMYQAIIATAVIVVDLLLKDRDNEAVYMMFYSGLLREITERGPDFMVKIFEKKCKQPKDKREHVCTYFKWFCVRLVDTSSRYAIYKGIYSDILHCDGAERPKDMMDKIKMNGRKIHRVTKSVSSTLFRKLYDNNRDVKVSIFNADNECKREFHICKDTTLAWWLRVYAIQCNYWSVLRSSKITTSTKYFRIVHIDKTFFLSSSGKKTFQELDIRDGDEVTVGGVDLEERANGNGLIITSSMKSEASSKVKTPKPLSGTSKKGKKLAVPTLVLTEDEIENKHRQAHSRAMTGVFEELNPLLKQIRTRLNNLTIHKPAPKVRKPKKKNNQPSTSIMNLPTTADCLGGKAGKISYPILVGEVTSLYKTTKSNKTTKSSWHPIVLDLHGFSKDEALKKLDECLPVWVETAMSGEAPWVLPVDIICGGGSQILSEAVKGWIRSNHQVANRPKSYN